MYRILIVDDDEIDRWHYTQLLARQHVFKCHVAAAADGAAGLAAIRDGDWDCVLLDFRLPDMTAIEFLEEVGTPAGLPCAVVLITGHGSELIAVEAMKSGVREYLVKGAAGDAKLARAVAGAIAERELRTRLDLSVAELRLSHERLEREVSTRKQVEESLRSAIEAAEAASSAKSRFLAGMSHELRTPLNGILGYAEMLRLEGRLNAAQAARVDAMLGAGRHLLSMITAVLDMSEIESGHLVLQHTDVDIQEIAAQCLDVVGAAAEGKGLTLQQSMMRGAPRRLVTDATRLRQIMLNLLGNAVKFTAAGGVGLRLCKSNSGAGLRIEVADTGPGVPADCRPRLFQDFERLSHSGRNTVEGSGLGLALSARLTSCLGGTIGHEDRPGGGSLFWVELPQQAAESAETQGADTRVAVAVPVHQRILRILVADDVLMNREVAKGFLRNAGHEVICAEDGLQALRLATDTDFDVILMDVSMPEMDGLEATRRIRALSGPRGRVPIAALTAQAFAEQVSLCRAAGMDAHLAKPFTFDGLLAAVSKAASRDFAPDQPHAVTLHHGAAGSIRQAPVPMKAPCVLPPPGARPSILDINKFRQAGAFLPRETVTQHLGTIAGRSRSLLQRLKRQAGADSAAALAADLHKIAGSAGLFGFERLSDTARRLEGDIIARSSDVSEQSAKMIACLEETLDLMLHEMPAHDMA